MGKKKSLKEQELEKELSVLKSNLEEKKDEFAILQRAFAALSLKFNVLQEIQEMIPAYLNLDELLDKIMDIVLRVMEVESGSLFLIDREKEELFFRVAKGPKGEAVKGYRLKIGEGIAGWVALQDEPVAISDVSKDPRFKREISEAIGYETRSILCVPIKVKGKVKGVIEVLNKLKEDIFVSDDIDLLSAIAHLTGIMMENVSKVGSGK